MHRGAERRFYDISRRSDPNRGDELGERLGKLGCLIMGYMIKLDWAELGKAGSRAARAWTFAFLEVFAAWVVVIVVFELIE